MKVCPKCKEEKLLSEFSRNSLKKDGLQVYCKVCVRGINFSYYQRTPEKNPQRRKFKEKACELAKLFVLSYLKTHPCVDCGETDPIVLEFDHIQQKKYGISRMVYAGMGVDSISKEIEKCEVRCANCHRRATAKRSGWNIKTFEFDVLGY